MLATGSLEMGLSRKSGLFFLFFLAVFVRILAIPVAPVALNPNDDEGGADLTAVRMIQAHRFVDEEGKPMTWAAPFYYFFLSCVYSIFGRDLFAARLVQSFLGGWLCLLIFLIAERCFGRKVAIVAGFLAAFYPPLVILSMRLLTETLFVFLVTLEIYLLYRMKEKPSFWSCVLGGGVLALATLTRPGILFFPFVAIPLTWIGWRKGKVHFRRILLLFSVYLVAFLLPIGLWSVRNYRAEGRFILVSSQMGRVLYSSYAPDPKRFGMVDKNDPVFIKGLSFPSYGERGNYLFRQTLVFLKERPWVALRLVPYKLFHFWVPLDWEILHNGHRTYNIGYAFLLPFFCYGLFLSFAFLKEAIWLYLPLFYFQALSIVFYGSPRFRLPIEPFLLVLASYGLVRFFGRFEKRAYPALLCSVWMGVNLTVGFLTVPLVESAKAMLGSPIFF